MDEINADIGDIDQSGPTMPTEEAAPQGPSWTEDKFSVGGKEVKGTREQILKWAEMGHGWPQKAQELNQKIKSYEAQKSEWEKAKELEQRFSPYAEIDKYAAENPDWWTQTQEAYKQKIAGAQSNPEVQALKQELAEIKNFVMETKNEKQSKQVEKEDSELSQEIESIRKSNPDVDFDSPDENGKSLEMKILEHAEANGLRNFRIAYRDYYHEHLLGKAKEQGKEAIVKERQKQTKLGILGQTQVPTKGLKVLENVKSKSYGDITRETLDEIRAGAFN
jgi:hypothetical protein